ncbi:MAG: siphovirus ReqiPepy6 Gp37-like family protein [Bacteroidales bacterium]|nr:siphovirus ReqiPepy6 Gp37-like family protein [Bacteroidales bacterium]
MVDVFVLNGDLEQVGVIDYYTSLIWANRYDEVGDCELYVQATSDALDLLRRGYYLSKPDDDMICRIETIELQTDVENGNYLVVTGYDVKKILFQRIIWSQTNVDGSVEEFLRTLVLRNLQNPTLSARQIRNASGRANFFNGNRKGFTEVLTKQVSYASVGETIKEICKTYGWGFRVLVDIGNFYFDLYKGTDRSTEVVFSNEYENLIETTYTEDSSNLANVALVAGEGEGSKRSRNVCGYAESLDRYELYVDARDISRTITWGDLIEMYPTTDQGGHGHIDTTSAGAIVYRMDIIDIAIVDENQLTELKRNYPNGQVIWKDGNRYYQCYNVIIADLDTDTLESGDSVILRDIVYSVYLLNRGYEKMAEYGSVVTFDGSVEPDVTFRYKEDYFLGDKVSVRNEYGIEVVARIVEVIETYDENGYRIEPRFEYLEVL